MLKGSAAVTEVLDAEGESSDVLGDAERRSTIWTPTGSYRRNRCNAADDDDPKFHPILIPTLLILGATFRVALKVHVNCVQRAKLTTALAWPHR